MCWERLFLAINLVLLLSIRIKVRSLLAMLALIVIRLLGSYEVRELVEKFGLFLILLVIVDHLEHYSFFVKMLYKSYLGFQFQS